jgi:hypothetical protein
VPSFTVTAAGQKVNLDPSGGAQAPFTVTNTSAQTLSGRLLATPTDPAKAEWLSIVGEPTRNFAPNAAEQVVVQLSVPPTTAPGSYAFRLDAVSEVDPDEDFTEGPSVAFDVAAPLAAPKKKFPWWILAIIGAVVLLIIIGVAVFLLTRGGGSSSNGNNNDTATQLVGTWRNVDPATRSTTHYVIAKSGDVLQISGFGACQPTDCDWAASVGGPRTVPVSNANDGTFTIVWNFGFKRQVDDMTLQNQRQGQRLRVSSSHTFTDGRPSRLETQFFQKAQ